MPSPARGSVCAPYSTCAIPVDPRQDPRNMVKDGWMCEPAPGPRQARHAKHPPFTPANAELPGLPDPTNRWEEVANLRKQQKATLIREGWKERIAAEHAEAHDPESGTVTHAHCLHEEDYDPNLDADHVRHLKIYRQ